MKPYKAKLTIFGIILFALFGFFWNMGAFRTPEPRDPLTSEQAAAEHRKFQELALKCMTERPKPVYCP